MDTSFDAYPLISIRRNSPGEAPNNSLKPDELPEIKPAIMPCKADASGRVPKEYSLADKPRLSELANWQQQRLPPSRAYPLPIAPDRADEHRTAYCGTRTREARRAASFARLIGMRDRLRNMADLFEHSFARLVCAAANTV